LVSFSALDEVSNSRALQKKSEAERADKSKKHGALGSGATATALTSGGITMTAVERAIESLAALVGKSYIKEEIVHGSYRCDFTVWGPNQKTIRFIGCYVCALCITVRGLSRKRNVFFCIRGGTCAYCI
jgi:hypothetical protein